MKVPPRFRACWRDFPKNLIERIAKKKDAILKRRAFGRSDSGNTYTPTELNELIAMN